MLSHYSFSISKGLIYVRVTRALSGTRFNSRSPHCVSGIPNASHFDRASNGARNVNDRAIIAIEQSN